MKRVLSVAPARHFFALTGLAFAASVGSLSAADHYYVNDHLATTTAVTDAAGEIAAIEADAFGTPVAGATQAARYTGKPYDKDIGAYVFPCRNYRSDEARWMSADPSGFPDGVNAYKYGSNPLNGFDPDGLTWAEAGSMFWDWVTGSGEQSRTFTENSNWVADLKSAPGVNKARDAFWVKNSGADIGSYQSLTNYKSDFGLTGLWNAGTNSTQQFIGSYRVDITLTADQREAIYVVTNTTSATSFLYGASPSWERETFSPGSNMKQTYTWKEKLE